jgi:DNA-binding GntR family transcriptional regulator
VITLDHNIDHSWKRIALSRSGETDIIAEKEPYSLAGKKSSMKSLMAYEKIRDIILSGEKLPGTRLILSDLESELGIGRGPIREALMRLDRSGLVKNIPYKGALVATPPKQKEILHIYDIRVDLEVKLAQEAMSNLSPTDLAELEALHREMLEIPPNYYSLDRQFHNIIYQASDLPHLHSIVKKLILPVETFLNAYHHETADYQRFNQEHALILSALKEKNPEALKSALTKNIQGGLEIIEKTYNRMVRRP